MIEIIPAIDILDGKCVRLEQGNYRLKKVYDKDPLDTAKSFEAIGIKRLHLVDLDGARAKRVMNWKILQQIAGKTALIIDFGGGIKQTDDIRIIFECGAAMAVIGSVAVTNRVLFQYWLVTYSPEKLILGADVKDRRIAVSAWDDITDIDLFQFLSDYEKIGIRQVLCTDISRDGMLQGPAVELYKEIIDRFPDLKVIASGGISSVEDLQILHESGVPAAIIGKALYEGKIKPSDLKKFL